MREEQDPKQQADDHTMKPEEVISPEAREQAEEDSTKTSEERLDEGAPTFHDAYGIEELEKDRGRELVSIATLPGWPGSSGNGHGWGKELNQALGGGICPGYSLAIGAATAKAGKTSLLMQLAVGLSLRTAELIENRKPGPLTPVLVCSEMSAQALTWRALARWTGYDSRIFRAGKNAQDLYIEGKPTEMDRAEHVAKAWQAAEDALTEGLFAESRRYMRGLSPHHKHLGGRALMEHLESMVGAWVMDLKAQYNREVWPVVVLDPIQRWTDSNLKELEALGGLVEALGTATEKHGWIVLMTSDATKATATRSADQEKPIDPKTLAAEVFRGSYKLQHLCDAAICLMADDGKDEDGSAPMKLVFALNRWGPDHLKSRYRWQRKTGRFEVVEMEKGDAGSYVDWEKHRR
jgi:hypothetical protein